MNMNFNNVLRNSGLMFSSLRKESSESLDKPIFLQPEKKYPTIPVQTNRYNSKIVVVAKYKRDWTSPYKKDDVRYQTYEEIRRLGYLDWTTPDLRDLLNGRNTNFCFNNQKQAIILETIAKRAKTSRIREFKFYTKGDKETFLYLSGESPFSAKSWEEYSLEKGFNPLMGKKESNDGYNPMETEETEEMKKSFSGF
uniref:Uncharacterized protein n=1 Tax=Arion vulgaris TaxID=1028688 RepID=A0A0B6YZG4_9EUPU